MEKEYYTWEPTGDEGETWWFDLPGVMERIPIPVENRWLLIWDINNDIKIARFCKLLNAFHLKLSDREPQDDWGIYLNIDQVLRWAYIGAGRDFKMKINPIVLDK